MTEIPSCISRIEAAPARIHRDSNPSRRWTVDGIHLVRRLGDDIVLLVVPPGLSEAAAGAVISRAVDSAGWSHPADLLTAPQNEGFLAATA